MIIKFFEKEKIDKVGLDFYLVYGDNEGQKKEVLESILKNFNGLVILVLYLLKQLGVKEVLTLIFLYSEQIVKPIILTETLEF